MSEPIDIPNANTGGFFSTWTWMSKNKEDETIFEVQDLSPEEPIDDSTLSEEEKTEESSNQEEEEDERTKWQREKSEYKYVNVKYDEYLGSKKCMAVSKSICYTVSKHISNTTIDVADFIQERPDWQKVWGVFIFTCTVPDMAPWIYTYLMLLAFIDKMEDRAHFAGKTYENPIDLTQDTDVNDDADVDDESSDPNDSSDDDDENKKDK